MNTTFLLNSLEEQIKDLVCQVARKDLKIQELETQLETTASNALERFRQLELIIKTQDNHIKLMEKALG